jgi:hypothetical protein
MLPTDKDFIELYQGLLILQDKIQSLGYTAPEIIQPAHEQLLVLINLTVEFARKTFLNPDGSVKPYWE